jgi:hypothetical protein
MSVQLALVYSCCDQLLVWTALPITSARRFSPLGPLGTVHDSFLMIAKRVPWAIPVTLDAILMDQSATGRIDPLLIAETTKEMLCNLGFG